MGVYKSDKVWIEHTASEREVILGSFPKYLFLTKEQHAERVRIEEGIFNMILQETGQLPEQCGLFTKNEFIVFWEDDSEVALDRTLFDGLGVVLTKAYSDVDTGNAMAGIPTWIHNVYFKLIS
jgi:hypothetical protein